MSRRYLLVTVFLIALLGAIIFLALHDSAQNAKSRSAVLSEVEPVTLQDNANLSGILLSQRYKDFLFTMSDFIHQNISPGDSLAVIQTAQVMQSGVVEVKIKTGSPKQVTFTASINRSQYNQLTIDVDAFKYHKVVQVY